MTHPMIIFFIFRILQFPHESLVQDGREQGAIHGPFDKRRRLFGERGQSATAILARFHEVAQMIEPRAIPVPAALRDPDDVHVLACAVTAPADAIATGFDLLALKEFEGVPIIEIKEALLRLGLETK
jgi:hypothetical protein